MAWGPNAGGPPVGEMMDRALQYRVGLGQFIAQRQEQHRIAQIDQAWKASGGDLNAFKSRGGYGLLHPQEAMALEDKLRQRERDAEQSRQFNETNARLKEQAAENIAQRVEDRTVRQVGQIQSRLGVEEALRVRQEEAAANRRSQEIRGIADRNLREQIAAERSAAGPAQGTVPFGWAVNEQGQPYPIPNGPADPGYIKRVAESRQAGAGGDWSDEALLNAVREERTTGKTPRISTRDQDAWARYYQLKAEAAREEGDRSGVLQAERMARNAADKASLVNVQKQRDMTRIAVDTMDSQISRVGKFLDEAFRLDPRLLNVPIVAWKKYVAGSPIESKIALYVTEISNESGKIATGSVGSIRELSESAQEKWANIHDLALSGSDMKDLLGETETAGKLRMKALDGGINSLQERIRQRDPLITGKRGKLTDPNIASEYLRKAGGDKAKARELAKQDGWEL